MRRVVRRAWKYLRHVPLAETLVGTSLNWLRTWRNRETIRHFDRDVPAESWAGAEFHERMIGPFAVPDPPEYDDFGMFQTRHFNGTTAALIADVVRRLRPRISAYLGSDARLDDMNLFWIDPAKGHSARSISSNWHDDNVGHRLKLYICLEGDGSTPTIVIPNSHIRKFSPRYSELLRFAGGRLRRLRREQIELRYRSGDVAIFDTHCLHRGGYEHPAGKRTVIVAEFIHREKSNRLAGTVSCAPGQSREGRLTFDPEALEQLRSTGLIDEELIADEGDHFSYSLANRQVLQQ